MGSRYPPTSGSPARKNPSRRQPQARQGTRQDQLRAELSKTKRQLREAKREAKRLVVQASLRAQQDLLQVEDVVSPQDLDRMKRLAVEAEKLQAEEAEVHRPALLKAMLAVDFDPVPWATVAQMRRLAEHRGRLLAGGAFTIDALRKLRGDASESSTRTWLARKRKREALFTVTHNGATLLPAFELGPDGEPFPALVNVLQVLNPLRLGDWATWTWFSSTTPWLGGERPAELLGTDPQRVVAAATRFAR